MLRSDVDKSLAVERIQSGKFESSKKWFIDFWSYNISIIGTARVVVSFGNQLRYWFVGTRRNEHSTILKDIYSIEEEIIDFFYLPDLKDNDQD